MALITIDKVEIINDDVTVTGTVDGVQVVCRVWLSHLNTINTKQQKRLYVASELKKSVPTISTLDLSGTAIVL